MAATGHFGNYLFNHLAHNIAPYKVFRVIGVNEFISNVFFIDLRFALNGHGSAVNDSSNWRVLQ